MLTVIAETKHWIAVNKQAGVNVEQLWDYPSVEKQVSDYLQEQGIRQPYVGIVHRLDRPVSGVLLLAKKKSTLKALNEQFRERQVHKIYWAVVEGQPEQTTGVLQHFLVKDQRLKRAFAYEKMRKGAVDARLSFQLLRKESQTSLLHIEPHSGKFHQIRVQLSTAGYPIVGDEKYGARMTARKSSILLHARALSFIDPQTGEKQVITASLPPGRDWQIGDGLQA